MKTLSIVYNPKLDASVRGTERDFLMHITDWLPTILEMTGEPLSSDYGEEILKKHVQCSLLNLNFQGLSKL